MITEASDCHLTRDKVMMEIVPSQRDNYAGLGFYVFNVVEGLQNIKTWTSRKELKSRWSQRQLKNHTCELIRLLK